MHHVYLKHGHANLFLERILLSNNDHLCRFQASSFQLFPSWLEYSHANMLFLFHMLPFW